MNVLCAIRFKRLRTYFDPSIDGLLHTYIRYIPHYTSMHIAFTHMCIYLHLCNFWLAMQIMQHCNKMHVPLIYKSAHLLGEEPASFSMAQQYWPAYILTTWGIVNVLTTYSSYLLVAYTAVSVTLEGGLVHTTLMSPYPLPVQENVISVYTAAVMFFGGISISGGGTVNTKQRFG